MGRLPGVGESIGPRGTPSAADSPFVDFYGRSCNIVYKESALSLMKTSLAFYRCCVPKRHYDGGRLVIWNGFKRGKFSRNTVSSGWIDAPGIATPLGMPSHIKTLVYLSVHYTMRSQSSSILKGMRYMIQVERRKKIHVITQKKKLWSLKTSEAICPRRR